MVSNSQVHGSEASKPEASNEVVMLDNYDSFTWNLYQYLCLLGGNMTVYRSEEVTLEELQAKHPNMTHLVISPGPGHPLRDSGISIPAIEAYAGKVPVLGVCMGLQSICAAYGGEVDVAGEVVHGKTSAIQHDGRGLFKGITQGIQATRYHSLAARLNSIPEQLQVTSRTESGVIMGLRHKQYAVEAVQYHPESILSEEGKQMLANFLALTKGTWAENPGYESAGKPELNGNDVGGPQTNGVKKAATGALPTILQKITEQRIQDVAKAKATPGFRPADLSSLICLHVAPPLISFYHRLQAPTGSSGQHMALLAEIKRASPSKGDIADASSPSSPAIALSYAHAGASVISVLTEPKWFKGSLEDMRAVRAAIDSLPNRPAVLRKDFILDTYQIDEARIYGADTVLLIVAMLTDAKLKELYDYSLSRGMEPLVEVNNADELARALAIGSKVIGVNNRNLHDFNVDMGTTTRVADAIKASEQKDGEKVILIALSGITGRADVEKYAEQGVSAVLVGESLMRSNDKRAFARSLLGIQADPTNKPRRTSPLVKICGIKTSEAAMTAAEAGADLLGFIFAPKSKRYVSPAQAREITAAVRSRQRSATTQAAKSKADSSDWFSFQTSRLAAKRKPLFVGVFQNASLDDILDTVEEAQLDVVQLHGDEPVSWARLIPVPVIKAFHVDSASELAGDGQVEESLRDASRPGYHAVALLDTKVGTGKGALSGGAGKTFDWSVARRLAEHGNDGTDDRLPIMLAGGLDASNVRDAIDQVGPWAIDVSGGVETNGEKDLDKIRELLKIVKGLEA